MFTAEDKDDYDQILWDTFYQKGLDFYLARSNDPYSNTGTAIEDVVGAAGKFADTCMQERALRKKEVSDES